MRTLSILLAVCALAAAGCGGGGQGGANQSTEPETTTTSGGEASGDADAGSIIWVNEGCSNCHELGGSPPTSLIGPNFDDELPNRDAIIDAVTHGKGTTMPAFDDSLSPQDIENVAAYMQQQSGT